MGLSYRELAELGDDVPVSVMFALMKKGNWGHALELVRAGAGVADCRDPYAMREMLWRDAPRMFRDAVFVENPRQMVSQEKHDLSPVSLATLWGSAEELEKVFECIEDFLAADKKLLETKLPGLDCLPLEVAASSNDPAKLKLLLDRGFSQSVDAPLTVAILSGSSLEVANMLMCSAGFGGVAPNLVMKILRPVWQKGDELGAWDKGYVVSPYTAAFVEGRDDVLLSLFERYGTRGLSCGSAYSPDTAHQKWKGNMLHTPLGLCLSSNKLSAADMESLFGLAGGFSRVAEDFLFESIHSTVGHLWYRKDSKDGTWRHGEDWGQIANTMDRSPEILFATHMLAQGLSLKEGVGLDEDKIRLLLSLGARPDMIAPENAKSERAVALLEYASLMRMKPDERKPVRTI